MQEFSFSTFTKHYVGYAHRHLTFGINVLKQCQSCLFYDMKYTFLVFQMELKEGLRATQNCEELLMSQKTTELADEKTPLGY